MYNNEYHDEDICIKEISFPVGVSSIEKYLQKHNTSASICSVRNNTPASEMFRHKAPRIYFLGYSTGRCPILGTQNYSLLNAIEDIKFMGERHPETKVITIAGPDDWKKLCKNGARDNICRRNHSNLEEEIAKMIILHLK